jgi:anti-sigma regulatory factor (Ser/Thr protein kinase)
VCWATERGFESEARTPSAARQFVASTLQRLLSPMAATEAIADAELVVSELVTNSVRSGAATVRVAVELHHGALEIGVTDDGPGWPTLVRPDADAAHGRGLVLVDALADRWQAEPIETGGKRVRVTLAVPAELTRSLQCHRPRADAAERGR